MTAARTLAIGALVLATAVPTALAGPYSGTFNWTSWNAGNGTMRATGKANSISLTPVNYPLTPATPTSTAPVVAPAPDLMPSPSFSTESSPSPVASATAINPNADVFAALARSNALPAGSPVASTPVPSSPPVAAPTPIAAPVMSMKNSPIVIQPLDMTGASDPVISSVQAQVSVRAPIQAAAPAMPSVAMANAAPVQTFAASTAPTVTTPHVTYDGYINLAGNGFLDATNLTSGSPQAWYNSNQITSLFGGRPTAQQQSDFNSAVLERVQHTFDLAGVQVNLTTDPNAHAAHTLSLVSNTQSAWGPLLGLTNIGGNGFSFIDQSAKSVQSVDQLEWMVAHNVAHELMLSFGVGEDYDKSGHYIDSALANLSMMLDANATFSQSAAAALLATGDFSVVGPSGGAFAQDVNPQPVPEPTTIAMWSVAALGLAYARHKRGGKSND